MANLDTRRRCPYCGETIELGDCPIVATNFEGAEWRGVTDIDLATIELPSKTVPLRLLPKSTWPVIADAPRQRPVVVAASPRRRSALELALGGGLTGSRAATATLPPLLGDGVAREDSPARACPACEFALPRDIDEREAVVVAVVGVNRVGKTHLLASSLTEAYRQNGLAKIGCTEFVPDEETGTRFMHDYYRPLFRRGEVLSATNAEDDSRFHPLIFNVTLDEAQPFTLIVHDIAGEVLADPHRRAHHAAYLRAARGIIFVVDPRDIDDLQDGLPDWMLENNEIGFDQGALLSGCLRANGELEGRRPVPLAITVTKADLLPLACGEVPAFLDAAPSDEPYAAFLSRIAATSKAVEAFLERHGAHSILGPSREYGGRLRDARATARDTWRAGSVTYHAVSALGAPPDVNEELQAKPQPLNALDPLAAILAQIAGPRPA